MDHCDSGAEKGISDDIPKKVRKFTYVDIYNATNNFTSIIGEGGFGIVYRARIDGTVVAVKKLRDSDSKDFINELKTLTRFQHENLLSIIGYCVEPACPYLVLEYMTNGSLADKLEDDSEPLSWDIRMKIAYGAALGINHLHTFGEKPMVHRDIKSANILLNEHFVAKVADFGLVRDDDSGLSKVRPVTKNLCFTPFYEAPEVWYGDVSIKLDTFSFGVVLLQLLTGLQAFHEGKPLQQYTEKQILTRLLDSRANWDRSAAERLYEISKRCLKKSKKSRPTISEILNDLEAALYYIYQDDKTNTFYDEKEKDDDDENYWSSEEGIEEYWSSREEIEDDVSSEEDIEYEENLEEDLGYNSANRVRIIQGPIRYQDSLRSYQDSFNEIIYHLPASGTSVWNHNFAGYRNHSYAGGYLQIG